MGYEEWMAMPGDEHGHANSASSVVVVKFFSRGFRIGAPDLDRVASGSGSRPAN
jgi:hypothetical protein